MYSMIPFRRGVSRDLMKPFASDRFFRSFFDVSDMVGSAGFRVDVRDEGESYKLEAELPGVAKDKINLSINEDVLTISADMNEEKKEEHKGYLYSERRTGHVERSFNLEGIHQEAITADYKDGVLTVSLPKAQPANKENEVRRIEIQ